MAMGPINYSTGVIDPITRALEGYAARIGQQQQDRSLGMEQQRIDLAQQAFAAEQQRIAAAEQQAMAQQQSQQAAQAAFAEYLIDPAKTYDKTVGVIKAYPQLAEAVMGQWQGMSAAQQDGTTTFAKQLTYALGSGNVDAATQLLTDRMTAAEAAGNLEEAATYKASLEALKMGDQGVQSVLGMGMMSLAGVLSPEEMKKHSELVMGPEVTLADEKTKAEIAKIEAETRKATAELANSGAPNDENRFEMEKKLRDEYLKNTAEFTGVREAYRRVAASDESAAGDLSLIFGYMKMLDPGSVVREGEFATAQNTAGIPDRIVNAYNKALSGERLSEEQRAEFKKQAEGLMSAAAKRENEVRKGLEPVIADYRLTPENIFTVGGDTVEEMTDEQFIAALIDKQKQGLPPTQSESERLFSIQNGRPPSEQEKAAIAANIAKRGGQ